MKRLIPAAIIVAAVLLLNVYSDRIVRESCAGALSLLEQCEEEWNADADYQRSLSKLQEYWEQKEYGLSFFVNHETLSNVELQIKGLFEENKSKETPVFHERIETIKVMLEQIVDDTKLNAKGLV